MIYLLDVNALVALAFMNHEFHGRVAAWVQSTNSAQLASCSITELGFVRVLAQAPAYGVSVAQARTLLLRIKQAKQPAFTFIRGRPRYFAASCLGENGESDHRWTFGQPGCRSRRHPGNTRPE